MAKTYEEVYSEICKVGEITTQMSAKVKSLGERHVLMLSHEDEEAHPVEVVYYGAKEDASKKPVIFGMHGGGFVVGGCAFDDEMWDALRHETGCNVISIGYRKSPAYAYPCALHDVYDAIRFCRDQASDLAFDRNQINVFGNSAGSTLATEVCLYAARHGGITFDRVLLNYPYVDLATTPEEKGAKEEEALTSRAFAAAYLQGQDPADPQVSPIYASDEEFAKFPSAWIAVCEHDMLRAEGETFAGKLKVAGVEVQMRLAEGMPHAYFEYAFGNPVPGEDEEIASIRADGTMQQQTEETLEFFARAFH